MSNLLIEMLVRLLKPALAVVLAGIAYLVAVGTGADPSVELALLCWLAAAALILLVQESPL